jgi:sporulation integral membrane protein YlbJ
VGWRGRWSVQHGYTLLLSALAVVLTVFMVVYPDLAFRSALKGLRVWWSIVFPALLPFFVGGHVLMGLGVVHFLGVLMEPFMRPLFNVPGVGAFVVAMGLASGYPIGSVLTAQLRREGLLTVAEAERLMSFTNTADPLFMAGAVAVGMFRDARLAGVLMGAHYLAALGTGLLLRFHRRHDPPSAGEGPGRGSVLARAVEALIRHRRKDGRAFGRLLGDAVRESVDTLLMIGGFIILFSVIIQILSRVGLVDRLAGLFAAVLAPFGINRAAASSLVSGFFEITIGTQAASQAPAPLLDRLVLASVVIAWSGLSVLGQVAAVTQGTGVSIVPYVVSRVVHAVLAGAFTVLLWRPGLAPRPGVAPVMAPVPVEQEAPWLGMAEAATLSFGLVLVVLAGVVVAWLVWRGVRVIAVRGR